MARSATPVDVANLVTGGSAAPTNLGGPADLAAQEDLAGRVAVVLDLGRARRRRAQRRLAAAAAALVLIAGAGVLLGERGDGGDGAYTMNAGGSVAMSVHVRDQPGGSALTVAVRGLPSGEQCTLVAVSTSGQRETAGTWTVTYNGSASVVETSTFPA